MSKLPQNASVVDIDRIVNNLKPFAFEGLLTRNILVNICCWVGQYNVLIRFKFKLFYQEVKLKGNILLSWTFENDYISNNDYLGDTCTYMEPPE